MEYEYRQPQSLFGWWFNPKNSFSIIKIPIGIILILSVIGAFLNDIIALVEAFRNEPLFTGMFLLVLFPVIITFFAGTILWGGLFYLPYHIFEEEKRNWKDLLIWIGILLIVVIILLGINFLIFGWTYTRFRY